MGFYREERVPNHSLFDLAYSCVGRYVGWTRVPFSCFWTDSKYWKGPILVLSPTEPKLFSVRFFVGPRANCFLAHVCVFFSYSSPLTSFALACDQRRSVWMTLLIRFECWGLRAPAVHGVSSKNYIYRLIPTEITPRGGNENIVIVRMLTSYNSQM